MRAHLAVLVVLALPLGCGSSEQSPGGTGGAAGGTSGATGGGRRRHRRRWRGSTGGAGGATGGSGGATGGSGGSTGGSGGAADAGSTGGAGGAGSPDAGTSADTWASFASGFFTSFCVACHDDDKKGVPARDYHMLANVMREKKEIACGLASSQAAWTQRGCSGFPPARQFPVGNGPKPTDAERDRLLRWIDAGTP
jgi:hypothetical protein